MSYIYDRLRFAKAGVLLNDRELTAHLVRAEVSKLDGRKVRIDDIVLRLEARIKHTNAIMIRASLFALVGLALLTAARYDVRLEISFLGVKLSQIENIKELVFVACFSATALFTAHSGERDSLVAVRDELVRRKYGDTAAKFVLVSTSAEPRSSYQLSFSASTARLTPGVFFIIQKAVLALSISIAIAVVISGILFLYFGVIIDIWSNPNIPRLISRIFVCVIAITILFDVLSWTLGLFRAKFIDEDKWDKFDFYNPGTVEISAEARKFIEEVARK